MGKETGGPAFPLPLGSETADGCEGMQLRDWMAGMAMQSIPLSLDDGEQGLIANAAYRMADAMIAARSR